jgi:co-chaperonin GroES (HSP10)
MTTTTEKLSPSAATEFDDLSKYFPEVDCPISPFGDRVTVQVQAPREKVGSIYLTAGDQGLEQSYQQTAKVVALGPLAEQLGDKLGYAVGQYVRVPLYGGDKIRMPIENHSQKDALFVTYRAHEIIAAVNCNPLAIKTIF